MLEHSTIEQGADGTWTAAGPRVGMTVAGKDAKLFKRRAIRPFAPGGRQDECLLVGELDGVRTYVAERDGHLHVVITRQDLRPEFTP